MALSDLRTAVKSRLQTVTGVGVVTDWEPYATRDEDIKTYFQSSSNQPLLGWTIMRESTAEVFYTQRQRNASTHQLVIRGYRGLDTSTFGASEKTFQDLVETVRTALRAEVNAKLGGHAIKVWPPQLRIFEPRTFAGVLVHYAELGLAAMELST